ncbi:Inositol-1-monophosphatase [Halomicronema hongdechloris C2206]|uniref:Inositol-1-monophosphatase n=1 Tax=Halomicronema hongdechloris C2206 TaxID=1641165 RepID=A0A1Z3HP93_9CYAN|nr:inositol monophosphatase family protein [Halomicronema hongdechloris]ASC72086.1 Inositol-1-monophosphatase [Halomicronema hongdechloris C2206]
MAPLATAELDAIQQLLLACGQQARQAATQVFEVFEKGQDDYVTSVDRALDQQLFQGFSRWFPQDGIITEENVASQSAFDQRHKRLWLIDPIDGTDNFIKQGRFYAIMVGLLQQSRPQAGWIYAPALDRLYWGGPDWGLFQAEAGNSYPLKPQPPEDTLRCDRILLGDKDRRRFGDAIARHSAALPWDAVGSFGLKVLAVMQGKASLYLYLNGRVKLWDTTGPLALATTAGLTCCDLAGNPIRFDGNAVDQQTLTHHQAILIGWPRRVDVLRPQIKRAVAEVLATETPVT